jgi:hypothetical protein
MEMITVEWLLFGIGFIPWRVNWQCIPEKNKDNQTQSLYSFTIKAAFWGYRVEWGPQGYHWQLTLPLIASLKAAIWSALQDLVKGK